MASFQKEAEKGLIFLSHVKMFHWFSKNYNEHKILDDVYSDFSEVLDRLIEAMISRDMSGKKLTEKSIKYEKLHMLIDDCCEHYSNLNNQIKEPEIQNILGEICEIFVKAKYLLRMN